jgi:hypothetical protein
MVAGKAVKFEVGAAFTVIVFDEVELHVPDETVRLAVFVPEVAQLTVCGPTPVDVKGIAPKPKFQVKVEPGGETPVNVKVPFDPTHNGAGDENVDVGGAVTVMICVEVPGEQAPLEGATFKVTE